MPPETEADLHRSGLMQILAGDSLQSKRRWVVLAVMLGTITVSLNNTALNPAIPAFMQVFNVGPITGSWIVVAFMIAMGMTMPLTGYLSKKYGNRNIYILGLTLFILGSLIGTIVNHMGWIIVARCIQGISSGLMIPLSLAIIFSVYPKHERGSVTGVWGAAVMLAPAVGPVLGGIVLEISSWRMLFLMNVPIGLMGLMIAFKALPDEYQPINIPFDWLGFSLISIGIGFVMLVLSRIKSIDDFLVPWHVYVFSVGLICLFIFVIVELRRQHPLLNLRIFKEKSYSYSVVISVAQTIGMFECLILTPLLIQLIFGYSPIWTGMALLCTAVSASFFVNIGGKVLDQHGPRMIVSLGVLLSGLATLSLGVLNTDTSIWFILLLMVLRGIGIGLAYMPVTTAGLNAIPEQYVAQGAAMNNILRRITASIAIILAAVYLEIRSQSFIQIKTTANVMQHVAINEVFYITGLIILLSLPFAFFFPRQEKNEEIKALGQ